MKKKQISLLCFVMLLVFMLSSTINVFADDIKVTVDNSYLSFDQPPVVQDGRILVPLKAIFQSLGANVNWDGATQTIIGTKDSTIVKLQLGNKNATINGNTVILDVPAISVNGRTVVPAKFIAESLGAKVDWNSGARTVIISTSNEGDITNKQQHKNILEVHFIDVGQGDCILVISPNGSVMLIDAGETTAGQKIVSYIKKSGITTIDKLVTTHPHADHIGGMQAVLNNFEVKKVYDSGFPHTTKTYENLLTKIDEKNIGFEIAQRGKQIDLDNNLVIDILHPTSTMKDINNNSIVLRITYDDVSFMLTGDAEKEAEEMILSHSPNLQSQILKVGHHGSNTSTSSEFLNAVKPKITIIQVGKNNTYGHPTEEILSRLNSLGIEIYRNDLQGDIVVKTDGKTYSVNTQPFTYKPIQKQELQPIPKLEYLGKVNINTASFEELQGIIHIGPERAQEIISKRPFSSVDELISINGIGPARIKDIKEEGKAYVD